MSFGISGTALISSLDETEFRSAQFDPAVVGTNVTASYFNADFGLSYNFREFYSHFTVLNVLSSQRELFRRGRVDPDNLLVSNDLRVPRVDNLRRYLIAVGYVFGRNRTRIEPSLLFQLTEFTDERTIDINAKIYRDAGENTTLWGGLSYRRSFEGAQFIQNGSFGEQRLQLFTPIVGVNHKNLTFSYNYSYQSGSIIFDNGGFHQITLGYDIGQNSDKRYDCYCPAANN